jgi:4-carboxymuconolactone decarboxylase
LNLQQQKREYEMKDIHEVFTAFKDEFPAIHGKYEELGREVHLHGGPLPEKVRLLLKVAISGASGHRRALETHLAKSKEAGVTEEEIMHALLLLIPTCGFPAFMEAFSTFKK